MLDARPVPPLRRPAALPRRALRPTVPWGGRAPRREETCFVSPRPQEIAKHLGVPLFADELFDPEVNIRFGAAYLGGLYHRFGEQIALAAGAYNAGSHAMMRWCDQWGSRPLDEFVELVTYDQAREYIKRVLTVYAHYRLLYRQPFELSLAVNPHYSGDGIDD